MKHKIIANEEGRLRKKVEDQAKEIRKLREAAAGAMELSAAADALIAQMGLKYGRKVAEDGEILGYRLRLPKYDVRETCGKWRVVIRTEKDREYVIGVVPREVEESGGA